MKKIEDKYQKLDDIYHVLKRNSMYIGSIKPNTTHKWLFINDKMVNKELTFNPGFIKLFDEIIINSIDENKREGSKLNIIKVNINDGKISIWDNGGIPVVKHKEHKEWIPEMIFSNLKSGSNFDDNDERTGSGTNGVGSVCVNIFSKEFSISTCDGVNNFYQVFYNNMRDRTKPKIKNSKNNHTEITYLPDYEKLGLTELDDIHFNLIRKRVIDLAGCNTNIKFYFNGDIIKVKSFEDYIKFYTDDYFFESNKEKTWSIAVAPSQEGFKQISFVNSTETFDGGNHVDYILNQIIVNLREYFKKKHKVDIKPSEIKNHMFLFLNSTIINPSFSAQTKEKLITEVKDFGYTYEISSKLINGILKSEIVQSILDWIDQKKLADENKLARDLNKNLSKIKVDKLVDAKGKDRWKCSLGIFEGDSAANGCRRYRDPDIMGFFPLKGKFINVSEIANSKLVANKEAVDLMAALGLKLGEKADRLRMRYGRIILYCDQDFDGYAITALLINFFNKYWPELFEYRMIYKAETPIVVVKNSKANKKENFYTQEDFLKWMETNKSKDWEISYKKGLSALDPDEYEEIIKKPKLVLINKDEFSDKKLNIWFGDDAELRKNELI